MDPVYQKHGDPSEIFGVSPGIVESTGPPRVVGEVTTRGVIETLGSSLLSVSGMARVRKCQVVLLG